MVEMLLNARHQAFSLIIGVLALVLFVQSFRKFTAANRAKLRKVDVNMSAIAKQLKDNSSNELSQAQAAYIENYVLPQYEQHHKEYISGSVKDGAVRFAMALLNTLILVVSSTEIINDLKSLIAAAVGAEALVLLIMPEPQAVIAMLSAANIPISFFNNSETVAIHRAAAQKLLAEMWEYLGMAQEYETGYRDGFSLFSETVGSIVSIAESHQKQQSTRTVQRSKPDNPQPKLEEQKQAAAADKPTLKEKPDAS